MDGWIDLQSIVLLPLRYCMDHKGPESLAVKEEEDLCVLR